MNTTRPLTDAEIEARLRQTFAAHEPMVDPDRATELMRAAHAAPRRTGPTLRWVASAAAVAVLAGGAYAVHATGVDPSPGGGSGAADTPSSVSTTAGGGHADPGTRAEAEAAVTRSWSVVPVLPGAQQVSVAPDPSLVEQTVSIGSNAAHGVRWWVASGTVAAAMAYLRAHPPEGFDPGGGGGDVVDGQMHKVGERLTWFGSDASVGGGETVLDVSVATHGAGVAVRVDSLVTYRPPRPADLWIDAATVTGATVVFVSRGDHGTEASRTAELDAQQARAVVDLVNAQPASLDQGGHSCPMTVGPARDEVMLRTNARPVSLTVGLGCGGGIRVGPGSSPSFLTNLAGQVEVDAALRRGSS